MGLRHFCWKYYYFPDLQECIVLTPKHKAYPHTITTFLIPPTYWSSRRSLFNSVVNLWETCFKGSKIDFIGIFIRINWFQKGENLSKHGVVRGHSINLLYQIELNMYIGSSPQGFCLIDREQDNSYWLHWLSYPDISLIIPALSQYWFHRY